MNDAVDMNPDVVPRANKLACKIYLQLGRNTRRESRCEWLRARREQRKVAGRRTLETRVRLHAGTLQKDYVSRAIIANIAMVKGFPGAISVLGFPRSSRARPL